MRKKMDNLTVLIIDDDKVDRLTYSRFLTENINQHIKIYEAEDAKKARELLNKYHFDCILLDYSLPGENGLALLKNLRESKMELPPVIILTGVGNEHIAVTSMKKGAFDYLIKNEITPRILITSIENAINHVNLQKQIEINRKLAEEKKQAEEHYRLKNEFLHNMSHELRTPINPIIGYVQLLQDELFGQLNQEQKDTLAIILKSTRNLLEIIDKAIKITEFAATEVILYPEDFMVAEALSEVIDSFKNLIDEKNIKITSEIDDKISKIHLDRVQFKAIIYNYLSNALKFTPNFGSIQVRITSQDKNIRLEVEDSGIGIDPNNIKKLFITFHQLNESITREYQGTGLGLSLTKYIAEALGGSVGATSKLGKGSIFYAILPNPLSCLLNLKKH
jgi:signal transduction histidine kinase